MRLDVLTDRSLIRADAPSTRYITARVVAPSAPRRADRLPVNVAFVLDRSGSMGDTRKFDLACRAVQNALGMLQETDRFALIVYDERIDVLTPSTLATGRDRAQALDALAQVRPRGSTDLGGGWLRGCEQVAAHLDRAGVSRCLLLTDGLANQGITDRGALAGHARELRVRGVVTSTIGVGADFDERLLRDMAHEGGGNFYFVEGASQIPGILTSELGEAAEVTVRDAELFVDLPRDADAEVLNRLRSRVDAATGRLTIDLGDLVSAQEIMAVIRITFAGGPLDDHRGAALAVSGRELAARQASCDVTWRYASHEENDAQPRVRSVDQEVATVFAARARAEATEANRDGNFAAAEHALRATARRIRSYAGSDAELNAMAGALEDAVQEYTAAAMSPVALKQSFFMAESALRFRESQGFARRRR